VPLVAFFWISDEMQNKTMSMKSVKRAADVDSEAEKRAEVCLRDFRSFSPTICEQEFTMKANRFVMPA
jgi:hypothetical protein